ncbi:MAG: transglutaminase domain-containing protein [Phycisphaerales bacterium]|nr:transglutaminase domain-containing protein [Phycisphaerales bacterium]
MNHLAVLLSLILTIPMGILATNADAQSRKNNPSDLDIELPENPYLSYYRPREWVVHQTVYLLLSQNVYLDRNFSIQAGKSEVFPEDIEFVYPLVYNSAASWSDPTEKILGTFYVNGRQLTVDPVIRYAPQTNAPYSIWNFNLRNARVLRFTMTTYTTSVDTIFHEKEALKLTWPDEWPTEAKAYLTPIIDSIGTPTSPPITAPRGTVVTAPDESVITDLVDLWTDGNDPKQLSPVLLAKYLTAKVVEHIYSNDRSLVVPTTSGFNNSLANNQGVGTTRNFGRSGFYAGFEVRTADQAARSKRGSRHDMTILLTAVLRAAGIPARSVIGIDNEESGDDRVQSWTEFALYDKDLDLLVWVPIDIDELRGRGIRSSRYKDKWKFFGTSDRLHTIAPVSFYFHPPAAYQSFEVPALYGIRSTEPLSRFVEQIITFSISRKTVRGDDKKD